MLGTARTSVGLAGPLSCCCSSQGASRGKAWGPRAIPVFFSSSFLYSGRQVGEEGME